MPLLQGQPFKLVKPIEESPQNSEIFTIDHTGEQFLSRGEFEDRLALYSQNIWTCQCTGKSGMTHQEAWSSEDLVKVSATAAIPTHLHKPLLNLIHHSLSSLDTLVDSSSVLCHSQFHVGEELTLVDSKPCQVKVIKVAECPREKCDSNGSTVEPVLVNGTPESNPSEVVNGTPNGICEPGQSTSPEKDNDSQLSKENSPRKDMLPRLYTVARMEDDFVIEGIFPKQLQRTYKVPSKDQFRLFIRSCAMKYRGTTCTHWVVSDDLILKHSIQSKLPAMFLSPKVAKRKSEAGSESVKKPKYNKSSVPYASSGNNAPGSAQHPTQTSSTKKASTMGAPKTINILPKLNQALSKASKNADKVPKKRGRPPLTKEEKEKNKMMRQQTLIDLANKMGSNPKLIKPKTTSLPETPTASTPMVPSPQVIPSPSTYKSPIKRATTAEALMKLPVMKRLVHEYKTIKGVMGQYRRMAYTMDLVLNKLSETQIELIPDENLRNDLYVRQKKVETKKFLETMTPDERKEYTKKKARTIALERWKERKLKNLKIEDKTLKDLLPLPLPVPVDTPKTVPNHLFGEVVMVTEFLKCYRELLFGEEKFKMTTSHLMEALSSGLAGYQVIADIICGLLPTIIHDETSKDFKELGMPLSSIPINYQTAPELTRLCLKRDDNEDYFYTTSDDYEQMGREELELSDELLEKLERNELWQLEPCEILDTLKALVHKTLVCSSLSVYMEEMDEKASMAFRERRIILKKLQKEKVEESQKRRAEQKKTKEVQPKKQRGRPKGYSPKFGGTMQDFYKKIQEQRDEAEKPMVNAVLQRRQSAENLRKEKALVEQLEKERSKQHEDDQKRNVADRKYNETATKRDDLLRRQPLGYDRHHNRYWIFHPSTPGLYMERGWIDPSTNCQFILKTSGKGSWSEPMDLPTSPMKKTKEEFPMQELPTTPKKEPEVDLKVNGTSLIENNIESVKCEPVEDMEEGCLTIVESPALVTPVKTSSSEVSDEDDKPLSAVKTKLHSEEEDDKPLSTVKSKLTLSPMKMSSRGKPPKEAYVLVDEDTQTFPRVEGNAWFHYESMEDIKGLLESLSDKGQRESQLLASLNLNKDRLQYHYNLKPEEIKLPEEVTDTIKQSLKEDVVQIERELTEGWLGSIVKFDEWEQQMQEADTVKKVGELLIEVQKNMQLKFLTGLMVPSKKQIANENPEAPPEFEEIEGLGVLRWREAVLASNTYSRLHVLVGLFDSSIKWERSMATRKCKICRSKQNTDPLLMCDKCESSYHMYCLRPPLKEDVVEPWLCPSCVPKKTRREEAPLIPDEDDPEEKDDPTFSLTGKERSCKKKAKQTPLVDIEKKNEQSCSVCYGRIGLITCSQCLTAYHSECHEPPLESRARKDWICATCKDPKAAKARRALEPPVDPLRPVVRRNVFGALDEITKQQSTRTSAKKLQEASPESANGKPQVKSRHVEPPEEDSSEEVLPTRGVRGAKAKAIAKGKGSGSRRSGRMLSRPKTYKYESEEVSEGSSEDEPQPRSSARPRRSAVSQKTAKIESEESDNDEEEEQDALPILEDSELDETQPSDQDGSDIDDSMQIDESAILDQSAEDEDNSDNVDMSEEET